MAFEENNRRDPGGHFFVSAWGKGVRQLSSPNNPVATKNPTQLASTRVPIAARDKSGAGSIGAATANIAPPCANVGVQSLRTCMSPASAAKTVINATRNAARLFPEPATRMSKTMAASAPRSAPAVFAPSRAGG